METKITYWALSGLTNCITSAVLGLFVYFKNRKNPINISYNLFCLSIAVWSYAYFFWQISSDAGSALFWCRALMAGAIFIAPCYLYYVCSVLNLRTQRRVLMSAYVFSCVSLLFDFTPLFVKSVSPKMWFKYWPDAGLVFGPFLTIWAGIVLYGFYLLIRSLKNTSGQGRNKMRYILFANILAWSGGGTNFPLWFNVPIPPVGNISISIYVVIVAYAIVRYRLMDIKVAFTRASIFLVVYTFVLGIPFIVLNRTGSGLLATTLAVIFATTGPLVYSFLQRKAEAVLLTQQRRYQRILLQAAMGMVTEHNLDKLSKLVVYMLKKTIKIRFAAFFIKDKETGVYRLKAIRSREPVTMPIVSLDPGHPFLQYLRKNREPSFVEDVPPVVKQSFSMTAKAQVIITASAGDDLLAFMLLGEKSNTQPYNEEDMNVFKILSRQAALAIQNCVFFVESQESQERMFAAEKLASIGGMADGVAHQIRNRLNEFSLVSGELKNEIEDFTGKHRERVDNDPDLRKSFAYMAKISDSLIKNVERTNGVIKGILDFAKVEKKENFFGIFHLQESVKLSCDLLMVKHEIASLPINVDLGADDCIYGIKSQITEVIYNLLDNAYEALQEKKRLIKNKGMDAFNPLVEVRLTHTQDRHIIKISDNGVGIKDDNKHKIFAPFFTTKSSYKSGSGIGVYVVKRIIEENHKGKIRFVSTYMSGTEFLIEIPRKIVI